MVIKKISIKNLKSFGNEKQEIELKNEGNLILLSGVNGSGKCVHPTTEIDVDIDIYAIDYNKEVMNFMAGTEVGKKILLYIKQKDNLLYERITNRNK